MSHAACHKNTSLDEFLGSHSCARIRAYRDHSPNALSPGRIAENYLERSSILAGSGRCGIRIPKWALPAASYVPRGQFGGLRTGSDKGGKRGSTRVKGVCILLFCLLYPRVCREVHSPEHAVHGLLSGVYVLPHVCACMLPLLKRFVPPTTLLRQGTLVSSRTWCHPDL